MAARLKRSAGLIRIVVRSRMALVGLGLLVFFTILAVGAPFITPYDPQRDIVAGAYAPPAWMTYLSEGSRLSQNMVLESNPGFPNEASLQGWTLQDGPGFSMAWNGEASKSFGGAGSVRIAFERSASTSGSFSTTFQKELYYPYTGPPYKFEASISVFTPTASPQEPVEVGLFIERLSDGKIWNLTDSRTWAVFPFNSSQWHHPAAEIDSSGFEIKRVLGVSIDPAALIFSRDNFVFGATITVTSAGGRTDPLEVYLDNVNLKFAGTAWGLLGTEHRGYDIFSQVIYGARISLLVGLLSAFIGISLGLVVGLIAGYMGKFVDEVLMRFTDMLLVVPSLPLLIVLIAVLGNSLGASRLPVLIIVIGFLGWMGFARLVRSQVLSLRERPFIEAAKAAGAGIRHIVVRHVVPNIVGLIYVNLALAVPGAILAEAALSFLGLGDLTVMSWGRMLFEVQDQNAQRVWWWVIPPGVSIALVSLSFVLIGYALDDIFNPRLRQRR